MLFINIYLQKREQKMLMDLRSGTIKINNELVIHPQYSFEDF